MRRKYMRTFYWFTLMDRHIRTDEELCSFVDELYHRLKVANSTQLVESLQSHLRQFIDENGLGWDRDSFCKLPRK